MNEDDDIGPISDEERAEAEALRRELDGEADPAPGSDAAFAAAVRASMKGAKPLTDERRQDAVKTAIAEGSRRARRRSVRTIFAIAAAAVLAIAVPTAMYAGAPRQPAITYGGPTDAIFGGGFEDTQRASERMDRIVNARTDDYFTALRGEQP